MSRLLNRTSALDRQMNESKGGPAPAHPMEADRVGQGDAVSGLPDPPEAPAGSPPPRLRGRQTLRDQRFADYLASSFEATRSLRTDRRTRRNKTIFMVVVACVVVLWALSRLFL